MRQRQSLFGRSRLGLNRGLAAAAMVAWVGLKEAEEGAGGKAVSYVFSPFLLFSLLCLSAPSSLRCVVAWGASSCSQVKIQQAQKPL